MLSLIQARKIAVDCIRQATGFSGEIKTSSVLKDIGVVDADARSAVNDDIVTDINIGVQHYGHVLAPSALTFTINSQLFQLRDEIAAKAQPRPEHPQKKVEKKKSSKKG